MKLYKVNTSTLTTLADIIRTKCSISDTMSLSTMIKNIYPATNSSNIVCIFENCPSIFDYTSATVEEFNLFYYVKTVEGKWGNKIINLFNSAIYLNLVHLLNDVELISCFNYCSSLNTVCLPNCTKITNCFNICSNLNSIILTKCENLIDSFNFDNNIVEIILPNCNYIKNAFMNCPTLSTVYFESLVNMSGVYNFLNCTSLHTLVFNNLNNITAGFCDNCPNLTSLYLLGDLITNLETTLIFSSASIPTIYVPTSCYEDYISATNWIQFSNYITSFASITDIDFLSSIFTSYFSSSSTSLSI